MPWWRGVLECTTVNQASTLLWLKTIRIAFIIVENITILLHTKGQLISNVFLVSSVSSKKRTKTSRPEVSYSIIVVKSNSFVRFLEEIDDPKNQFEIKWPLQLCHFYCGILKKVGPTKQDFLAKNKSIYTRSIRLLA